MKSKFLHILGVLATVHCLMSIVPATIQNSDQTAVFQNNHGTLRGVIRDAESGESMPFVTVVLEGMNMGVMTDFEGFFYIKEVPAGMYNVIVSSIGYQTLRFENVEIENGEVVQLDGEMESSLEELKVIELKPMIYMYPEATQDVQVNLNYDGELTHTYPKSDGNWEVLAEPDGTLADKDGRNYYGLFWEGIPNEPIQPNCGSVVSKDSLISFLETSLEQLGLNYKEANEFIVFWLPILEQNPYNLIYFAEEDYTDHAELNITPKPDNLIRVMMGYIPLKSPIDIKPQVLPEKPSREGFTVVEWGGARCHSVHL